MAEIFWPFPREKVIEWPGTRPKGWAYHIGTDFAVDHGTPLRASMSGTVDIIWDDGLGAWVIDIIAPDGTVVRNGHLSAMYPVDGAWVNAGDLIGRTGGNPGTPGAGLSTGGHLHWEIRDNRGWYNGGWFDPRNLNIKTFGSSAGSETNKIPATPGAGKGKDMFMIALPKGAPNKTDTLFAVVGTNFFLEFTGQSAANNLNRQLTGNTTSPSLVVSKAFWDSCKKSAKTGSNK